MSRVRDLIEAEEACEEMKTCLTCEVIPESGEKYCPSCKQYWKDVEEGVFDYD